MLKFMLLHKLVISLASQFIKCCVQVYMVCFPLARFSGGTFVFFEARI